MDGEKMLIIMIMINGGIMAIKKMIVGETMKIIIIIKMRTMDGEVVKIIIEIIKTKKPKNSKVNKAAIAE